MDSKLTKKMDIICNRCGKVVCEIHGSDWFPYEFENKKGANTMKVTREKPEILRFIYRQEPGDPHYGSCLWTVFDLDPGRGMLNIQSDCGNYAYRWPERGENFLRLLAGNMTDGYLLEKLCGKPKEFDAEVTLAEVREYLQDAEYFKDEDSNRLKKERAIKDLEDELSQYDLEDEPGIAAFIVDNWNSDNNMEIDCAWELVVKKYGTWQKRIVKIFKEYIVPEIRKTISEGACHGAEDEN